MVVSLSELFEVFFHQKGLSEAHKGMILHGPVSDQVIIEQCERLYNRYQEDVFGTYEKLQLEQLLMDGASHKKHVEIYCFQTELEEEALLEELEELFPLFIWTKIVEEFEANCYIYSCEFIPVAFSEDLPTINANLGESLQQMNYGPQQSVSGIVKDRLANDDKVDEFLFDDAFSDLDTQVEHDPLSRTYSDFNQELQFPVKVSFESKEEEDIDWLEESFLAEEEVPLVAETSQEEEELTAATVAKGKKERSLEQRKKPLKDVTVVRSEENEVRFLQESLKREKASKERIKVAKDRLEQELLSTEKSLLASGLKQFKRQQKNNTDEEEWYDIVKIDLFQYDELYKKAKFLKQAWDVNHQLMATLSENNRQELADIYNQSRVASVKSEVSELELEAMIEQGQLIKERVKINHGSWLAKPKARLYQIDYEQLEKIGAFFDIIQTENRLMERVLDEA